MLVEGSVRVLYRAAELQSQRRIWTVGGQAPPDEPEQVCPW